MIRNFYIPNGQFTGSYKFYSSLDEFRKENKDEIYHQWARAENPFDLKVGDWIESLDGYFVPILKIDMAENGSSLRIRLPNGTFAIHARKKHYFWQKYYAIATMRDPYSLSGIPSATGHRGIAEKDKLRAFGQLVANGTDLIPAYSSVGFKGKLPKWKINMKAAELLLNEVVMEEIQKVNGNFLQEMVADERFSNERMKEYVSDFMDKVKLGSQTQLNSIIPLLSLMGKLPDNLANRNTKSKANNLKEVEFEEVPPPEDLT